MTVRNYFCREWKDVYLWEIRLLQVVGQPPVGQGYCQEVKGLAKPHWIYFHFYIDLKKVAFVYDMLFYCIVCGLKKSCALPWCISYPNVMQTMLGKYAIPFVHCNSTAMG